MSYCPTCCGIDLNFYMRFYYNGYKDSLNVYYITNFYNVDYYDPYYDNPDYYKKPLIYGNPIVYQQQCAIKRHKLFYGKDPELYDAEILLNSSEFKEEDLDGVPHYIYLRQDGKFIKDKQPIFKIGRVIYEFGICGKFKQYPVGKNYYLTYTLCDDKADDEKEILKIFKKNFKERLDIGPKYFEGDPHHMLRLLREYAFKSENFDIDSA